MANRRIAVQRLTKTGLDLTDTGTLLTADVHQVNNDGRVVLHFKKTGAGACVVTVQTPGTVDGLAIAEHTVSVPATTGDIHMGPFDPRVFNVFGGHDLEFTLSEITGLTVAAFRIDSV